MHLRLLRRRAGAGSDRDFLPDLAAVGAAWRSGLVEETRGGARLGHRRSSRLAGRQPGAGPGPRLPVSRAFLRQLGY